MTLPRRYRLLCALLFFVAAMAHGASVSERSPVRLGLWWDPAVAGSGFELFAAGGDQVLVWYTYREDGSPVWYTAGARFDAAGEWRAPLQEHAWVGGKGESRNVGTVALRREHFESLALEFEIGGRRGTQALLPFPVSGIVPEIDHSGAFYDPRTSGYGLGLSEQGETVIAGLYFYDSAGKATWRVGDNGGRGDDYTMRGYRGPCPGCALTPVASLDSGRLTLQRHEESRVTAKYVGAAGATWPLDGELRQLSTPASRRPADRQLASFDSIDAVRSYVEGAVLNSDPPLPVIDFSPPPQMTSFSTTNTQEAGVDEADTVETDGRFLYAFATKTGQTGRVLRIGETAEGGSLQMHADREFASLSGMPYQAGMYLHDAHLALLTSTSPSGYAGSSLWSDPWAWSDGITKLEVLDRSNPRLPVSRGLLEFDSHLVSSRRVGNRLFLVLRKSVTVEGFNYWGGDSAEDDAHNRALLAQVPTAQLLPRVRVGGGELVPLVAPDKIYLPVTGGLPDSAEFITVVGIDLATPTTFEALSVAGSVGAVYASPTRLYVATTRNAMVYHPVQGFTGPGLAVTDIHEIELGATGPKAGATGSIEGYLDRNVDRAAFRFSEKDGRLRVVTVGNWGGLGQNRLSILERSAISPGLLKTLAWLPNRDAPQPIGKPGEQLYGTRFLGDKLYAVTFKRIDPLYVIDLSDPAHPRIDGEVELPGYSDYLHPVGENLLLGIGHDALEIPGWAGPMALLQGVQFNLFDVSDPAHPRVLQQETIGKRGTGTAVSMSHHALSVLPRADGMSLTLPLRVHEDLPGDPLVTSPWQTARWSWSGLQRVDVVGTTPSAARLVVGQKLVTHSRASGNDPGYDDALYGARSVQFARGTVYVEHGRFWLAGQEGSLLAGPL